MIILVLAYLIHVCSSATFEFPNDDFCPPTLPKYKPYIKENANPDRLPLNKDEESGCLCRELPIKWTICFGRESCRRFPRNYKSTASALKIQTTLIRNLYKQDLENFTHLNSMDIEANYFLKNIEGGAFWNMTNLTNLSISYNPNLKILEKNAFEGLINLKELFLIKNGFNNILNVATALSSSILQSIYKLSLSENTFREIKRDDFKPMLGSSLSELNLVLCQIEYIHSQALAPFINLSSIRLGENRFNTSVIFELIKTSIELGIPLKYLNLYAVGFRKSPPKQLLKSVSNSSINQLCLARNQFEVIEKDTFPFMPKLEYLDLREVLALNITSDAFSNIPSLHTLLLNSNKLASIPDGVLLESLTYLDLSANSGNAFFPSYFSLGRNKFIKMKKLKYLNLSYNQLNTLLNATFTGLSQLRVLGLKNATIYHISEGTFLPLQSLLVLNLENNPFPKNSPLSAEMFSGLENLQILLLGGCEIKSISQNLNPFRYLTSLSHLGLENNHLLTLSPIVISPLITLITIDISRNFLSPWQERVFAENTNLSIVLASHNKFSYLNKEMLEDFANLSRLDISDNPFTCECETFLPLGEWYAENKNSNILELMDENPSFCVYPDETGDENILEFFDSLKNGSRICGTIYDPQLSLLYILPFTAFAVIILAIGTLAYLYRWHIRYWMFLARINIRRYGKRRSKRKPNSYENYQYDAFVSYCNEDRNFVIRLVAMLENFEPFLKLCVYERDFQIGSVISETVLKSVEQSRKTLLIISDSYARSQWCRWEVQIAEHHRLFFEDDKGDYVNDSLIMIKLGEVSEAHLTPTLKYLMKTRIYLQWESEPKKQKLFWDKLRKTLGYSKIIYDSSV